MAKHKKHNPWPGRVAAMSAVALVMSFLAGPAFADSVELAPQNVTVVPGGSGTFTVQLGIESGGSSTADVEGCNASVGSPVTINFSAEDGWASLSPASVTVDDCVTTETVTVNVAAGTPLNAQTKVTGVAEGGLQDVPVIVGGGKNTTTVYVDSTFSSDFLNVKTPVDSDLDGVADATDNCVNVANADQLNTDGDAQGNACDSDDDNDGVADPNDGCPLIAPSTDDNNDGCEDAVLDTTAPGAAAIVINDGDSWTNTTSVSVDLEATDNIGVVSYALATTQAGLDSAVPVAVTAATTFSRDDVGTALAGADATASAVWVRYFDAAGNSTDANDTIGLDTAAPVITGDTGTYTPGTWTNQDVVVSFSCAEAGTVQSNIAIDTVAGDTVSTSAADQSLPNAGACTDTAGNSASVATVTDIDIDKVAPVAGFAAGSPADGGTYWSTTVPAAAAACSDVLSLIATTGGCVLSTSNSGTQRTITATAADNAGNTATASRTFTVNTLTSTGFYQPVDMGAAAVNTAKAGSTVPMKFNLKVNGINSTDTTGIKATFRSVACGDLSSALADEIEQVTSGGTSLRYDGIGNQFIQNWQTPKLAGCYRAGVILPDLTQIVASFRLR